MTTQFNDQGWWPILTTNLSLPKDENLPHCITSISSSNKTIVFDEGWKAIPETIVFNLVLFFFFLFIFIMLRRIAWDRKHVNIRRTSKGWLQSIYGDRKLAAKSLINRENSPIIHHKHDLQIDLLMPPQKKSSADIIETIHESTDGDGDVSTIEDGGAVAGGEGGVAGGGGGSSSSSSHSGDRNETDTNLETAIKVDIDSNVDDAIHLTLPVADETSLKRSTPTSNDITVNSSNRTRPNEPEGILGTSFDFVNIPTNIQATFADVGYKLSDVLLISNKDILNSRGNDALQYLLFQQYIIYFLAILSIFCMLVVLPVNLQGNEFGTKQGFARTQIINLPQNSQLYWVHVIGASIISLIGIFMMHRFSKVIKLDEEQITRRTLLIRRIPKNKRNKELIAEYLKKAVPNCVIEGIQSVYNVRELTRLTNELTNLVNARCYCIEYLELNAKRLKIRPSSFGEFGCLCCGCCEKCKKVDGIRFYAKAEDDLQQQITTEMNKAVSHPTGAFFITFQTERMAQQAFVHLKKQQEEASSCCFPFNNAYIQFTTCCKRCFNIPETQDLEVSRWMITYAPYPDDINWCDMTVNLKNQWSRSIFVNCSLLILFVFFSTPTVISNASDKLKQSNLISWLQILLPDTIGSKVPELVGPFILVIAASALPAIVTLACQSIAYVNMSAKSHAIMWKVYLFLVLMVIIWPSLGLTSLQAFLLKMMRKNDGFPWNCLFPVEIGSFFVNYTIQYAFLGNIMELIRLPELLIYLWYMAFARSKAEVDTASRYVVWDFSIGIRYPRFLLIFAMVVTYSLSCPLITLAGLVYMVIKHLIDRYNIYYVYNPSKINSNIHSTAIMFVHIAFLMMQVQIFTVTFVRTGYSRVFALAMCGLLVSVLVFVGHLFFYIFRNINHLTYRATRKQTKTQREYCACAYLPPVLYNLTRYTLNKSPSVGNAISNGANGNGAGSSSSGGTIGSEVLKSTVNCGGDSLGSSQNLLVSTIDTSDAFFLRGSNGIGNERPKFSHHTTMLSTRKHNTKSRRTASDGQQQYHPNRLIKYQELQLKRTNSDLDNVM